MKIRPGLFYQNMFSKLTKQIQLVLISSALIFGGCAHHSRTEGEGEGGGHSWWYFSHSHGYSVPHVSSGSGFTIGGGHHVSTSSSFKSTSISARGGFGSSGAAHGSSGASS